MPLRLLTLLAALTAIASFAPPASAALHLSPIGNFSQPVYITAPPGDPHRVFVVEQEGRIIEVRDGVKQSPAFLGITRDVKSGGEEGLLSMAFAPDYATTGRYYVYYTAPRAGDDGGNVITVEEFSPSGRRVVFTVDHPVNGNHNGGQLQFGPDGLLYAGTGDGGSGNDPPGNAQNPGSRLGKLLRVNPLAAGAATPQIYAYGLRNPFRFSFDRQKGDLIVGDVGQGQREEVDFATKGTAAGINYGWRCWEGTIQTPGISPACDPPNDVFPVLEKNHASDGYCAIIGGYVVRDASLGALAGRYLYGDNCANGVRAVTLPAANDDIATGLTVSGLTSFGEDSCGHVYAASGGGAVYRIDGDSFAPCPEPSPPGGGTPPPGGGTPPPDTTRPGFHVYAWPNQHALRNGGFWVRVRCTELCGVMLDGGFRIKGSSRAYKLKRVTRLLAAGGPTQVTLRPWSRGLKDLRAALRARRRVVASITGTASDAARNATPAAKTIRAVR
ncbi:MAG: hypothetical protein QOH76_1759 [Thermoleophilaceae bacterium]|nr:hypothetical protein [Thermoleophilaceae bacterium]